MRGNGDLTYTVYDDRNDNGAVDNGEAIYTTPPPILPPIGGPPAGGGGGGGVAGKLLGVVFEDLFEIHQRAFVLMDDQLFATYCGGGTVRFA